MFCQEHHCIRCSVDNERESLATRIVWREMWQRADVNLR